MSLEHRVINTRSNIYKNKNSVRITYTNVFSHLRSRDRKLRIFSKPELNITDCLNPSWFCCCLNALSHVSLSWEFFFLNLGGNFCLLLGSLTNDLLLELTSWCSCCVVVWLDTSSSCLALVPGTSLHIQPQSTSKGGLCVTL